jgi:hypothetical protein
MRGPAGCEALTPCPSPILLSTAGGRGEFRILALVPVTDDVRRECQG